MTAPDVGQAEDLGPCPFCGRGIAADVTSGAVMHELPMCPTYRRLDAGAFLRAVAAKLEALAKLAPS